MNPQLFKAPETCLLIIITNGFFAKGSQFLLREKLALCV